MVAWAQGYRVARLQSHKVPGVEGAVSQRNLSAELVKEIGI